MTKEKLKSYIQKDLRKLDKEQKAEVKKIDAPKKGIQHSIELLAYLVSRKNTLKEILSLL